MEDAAVTPRATLEVALGNLAPAIDILTDHCYDNAATVCP